LDLKNDILGLGGSKGWLKEEDERRGRNIFAFGIGPFLSFKGNH